MGNSKYMYTRICDCGDIKEISYIPKDGAKCRSCASVARNLVKNAKLTYKRYTYTCPDCNETRETIAKRASSVCGKCMRIRVGKGNRKEEKMRYYRICPMCPENEATVQVASSQRAGIRPCRQHKPKKVKPKTRKKHYSPIGTDGNKKVTVRFQVVDEATMEAPVRVYKKKDIVNNLSDDASLAMQEKFLKEKQNG